MTTNVTEFGKVSVVAYSMYYTRIHLETLKKTNKNLNQDSRLYDGE